MKDPTIRLTVICPRCGRGTLAQLRIAVIAQAFILEIPIRLHATCHDLWWDASYLERQELREHLIGMQFKAGPDRDQHGKVSIGPGRTTLSWTPLAKI